MLLVAVPAGRLVAPAGGRLAVPVAAAFAVVALADGQPVAPVVVAAFAAGQPADERLVVPAAFAAALAGVPLVALADGQLVVLAAAPAFVVGQLADGRLVAPAAALVFAAGRLAVSAVVLPFLPDRYYFVRAVLRPGPVYADAFQPGRLVRAVQVDCLAVRRVVDLLVVEVAMQWAQFYDGLFLVRVHCLEVRQVYFLRVALAGRHPVRVVWQEG